jgi:predicted transposase YdaD
MPGVVNDPWFERLKNRFREEGRAEGRAKGRVEGRLEGTREVVVRLALSRGLVVGPGHRRTLDECRDLEQLQTWGVRVWTATSLEEALSD